MERIRGAARALPEPALLRVAIDAAAAHKKTARWSNLKGCVMRDDVMRFDGMIVEWSEP